MLTSYDMRRVMLWPITRGLTLSGRKVTIAINRRRADRKALRANFPKRHCEGLGQGAGSMAASVSRVLAFAVLFAVGVVVTPARAQTNWTGTNNIGWFDPGNWDAGVPTPAIAANINTITPNATVVAAPGFAATLSVGD